MAALTPLGPEGGVEQASGTAGGCPGRIGLERVAGGRRGGGDGAKATVRSEGPGTEVVGRQGAGPAGAPAVTGVVVRRGSGRGGRGAGLREQVMNSSLEAARTGAINLLGREGSRAAAPAQCPPASHARPLIRLAARQIRACGPG